MSKELETKLRKLRERLYNMWLWDEVERIDECIALASARTNEDAERLDWLDRVNKRCNEHNGTVYGWRYDLNHNRARLSDSHLPALTVRQAIDEAMAKSSLK